MSEPSEFAYRAMDPQGRPVRGLISAGSEALAFDELKRKGLSPTHLHPARAGSPSVNRDSLSARRVADLLFELSALMEAGADIKSALSIAASKLEHGATAAALRSITQKVSGGERLSESVRGSLGARGRFTAALIAAGEARGVT